MPRQHGARRTSAPGSRGWSDGPARRWWVVGQGGRTGEGDLGGGVVRRDVIRVQVPGGQTRAAPRGRSLDATAALGSRPAPNVIQPARPHQAASSRATLAGGAARAAKLGIFTVALPASTDICDQARGRPSLRRDSRPSRGSAALAFPTSGISTERVRGQHAGSQMHGRLRRPCRAEEDRCPVFASRAASADRYDSTCYRVTRCETGHSCCRAAHWRTRAVVWCDCTAAESGRAFGFEG